MPKPKIIMIKPYYKESWAAYFNNGRVSIFLKKDLDADFLNDLEKAEQFMAGKQKAKPAKRRLRSS